MDFPFDIYQVAEQLGLEIDKKKVEIDSPIKVVGSYSAVLKLYQEIKGELKVNVVAE